MKDNESEYYNRFMFAFKLSVPPATRFPLKEEELKRMHENREMAAILAERGIKLKLFNTVEEIRIAAQAILNQAIAEESITVYHCELFIPCAMNGIIRARADRGDLPKALAGISVLEFSGCKNPDCPKSGLPMVYHEGDPALAESGRWTEDTASVGRAR